MVKESIYLDFASTTPVDELVARKMSGYFTDYFGNPSGLYKQSRIAKSALNQATQEIAKFLNCKPAEIIFTSGGTESDNLAIFGLAKKYPGGHLITTKIEHDAVLKPFKELEKNGYKVTYLNVDEEGFIDLKELKEAIIDETFLVSIIYANNEIGTIQDIQKISKIIKEKNPKTFFHSDACQATQYLPMDTKSLGVDLLTINGSKIYGPKGVGALYIKEGVKIEPMIYGGGQQANLRSGTENISGIIGLAAAIKLIKSKKTSKESILRDDLIDQLLKIDGSVLNGPRNKRLPNNINISFPGAEGESAVLMLDQKGIACSTGSACSSGSLQGSHVIMAISSDSERAHCTLRFTLGNSTTKEQIDKTVEEVKNVVAKLRKISGYKNEK